MMAGEAQWVRGLVHFAEDDQVVNNDWVGSAVNFGEDSWDDSAILDIFDSAIRSHKTKKEMVQTVTLFYLKHFLNDM